MRTFFSYMAAGILVSSLSVFACSTTTTTSDDDDDDDTTSSSGDGGRASSSSGDAGRTSSSSSGGSSSSGSSSGSTTSFTISNFAIDPGTGTTDAVGNHTATFDYEGTFDQEAGITVVLGPTALPDGVEEADLNGKIAFVGEPAVTATSATITFTFNPPGAGTYSFTGGFDVDGDLSTTNDVFIATTGADVVVTD